LGGYFSTIAEKNQEQPPHFFFFSRAVEAFVQTTYKPYSSKGVDFPNVTYVLETLDLTVVANVGHSYNMSFVIAKNLGDGTFMCAYSAPKIFTQQSVVDDFRTTVIYSVALWVVGIVMMINCKMCFERDKYFDNGSRADDPCTRLARAAEGVKPPDTTNTETNYPKNKKKKKMSALLKKLRDILLRSI